MRLLVSLFVGVLLLAACSTSSETPAEPPPPMPEMSNPRDFNDADRDACAAAGGFYERAGMLGWYRCTQQFADGGQFCRDGSECSGRCMAPDGPRMDENGEMLPVTGVCARTDNPFGCYSTVKDGYATSTICVD